ncbi:CaiF/GrlA family transcriptional regulator [Salmonella enterica subsp. enterica]|nr:CaiF/GrlA family transcriptional regulator [Salmonella enterica]ECC3607921.1 CaiF/GrlA family transcriptional regulator [Salmonella enterica subsp. enterica]ECY4645559.1 CaiF/GrlA family transcriptional regulator [Salmonella enterica subsp. enterica serovar Eastbourne]ECE0941387.1 CaiF/GrlA family transcriptional regulator [Salmonella enterica subsp. enterica]ECH9421195.1 CaiF/GrlA family transcriptional regulator [Salmonella enterica subsp. enterica]
MPGCMRRSSVAGGDFRRERVAEGWQSPPEITHLGDVPLYQAVACWSLLLERAVTVAEVSQAFYVSARRASDVLHYISHDAHDVIVAESCILRSQRGRRKAVRVLSVQSRLFSGGKKGGCHKSTSLPDSRGRTAGHGRKYRESQHSDAVQALRAWFVSRCQGERVPEVAPAASPDDGAARMLPDSGE